MAEADLDILAESLREDRGMTRLLDALALGEGFRFHILVCETPLTARAAVRLLEKEARGSVVRIQPQWDVGDPLTLEEIVATVLEPLVALGEPGKELPGVIVLDASDAVESDDPAWRNAFRIMNERRNGITGRLPCAFVLAVNPGLEMLFAREAPDFWSVRSTTTRLETVGVAAPVMQIERERELVREERAVSWATDPEKLRREVGEARKRVAEAPEDSSALAALSIWLDRLGQYEVERGTLDKALAVFEEALEVDRRRVEQDPGHPEWLWDLSVSLERVGDVHRARGTLDRALSFHEESLGLRHRLLEQDPERPTRLRDLSASLEHVGDVHRARGTLDRALSSYEEALGLMRRLLEQDPGRAEWLRELSVRLIKVGDVHRARGSLDRALSSYEESLDLVRRLVGRDLAHPEWLRDLSVSLERVGDVHRARGSLDRALSSYEESLGLRRTLLDQDPGRPQWRWDLALSLWRVGSTHEGQGRLEEARSEIEEAVETVHRLLENFPERPAHLEGFPEDLERDLEALKSRLAQASSQLEPPPS